MSVNLKVNIGTVNYLDFLHVTASKVSSPSVIAWQGWIDVPITNYNLIIPGLDPEIYYIRFYDAATNSSLGTLESELLVNALTSEYIFERRFYTVNGAGPYAPIPGTKYILDPYLIDKKITGVFKEAFRYFEPGTEYTTDTDLGRIDLITDTSLNDGEKISVEIQYAIAAQNTNTAGVGGLYSGTMNIVEQARTLLPGEVNNRVRLVGTTSNQTVTLCNLTSIAMDNGYYFDNTTDGIAIQTRILTAPGQSIMYNGFNTTSNLFSEFWVSKGEHLLLRKMSDTYWEVILDYKGNNVGEKVTLGYNKHINTLPENGQLLSGNIYPRLWWWVTNVLPATHKYSVPDINYPNSFVIDRLGQFIIDLPAKLFRMPRTNGYSEKGLNDFNVHGLYSSERTVDYPGGLQKEMLMDHNHTFLINENGTGNSSGPTYSRPAMTDNNNIVLGTGITKDVVVNGSNVTGTEQRVKNIGVIFARRI